MVGMTTAVEQRDGRTRFQAARRIILETLRAGKSHYGAATAAMVPYSTYMMWRRKYDKFKRETDNAYMAGTAALDRVVVEAAERDPRIALEVLKHRPESGYTRKQSVEQTGTVQVEHRHIISKEDAAEAARIVDGMRIGLEPGQYRIVEDESDTSGIVHVTPVDEPEDDGDDDEPPDTAVPALII